jgi:hypothetical protein
MEAYFHSTWASLRDPAGLLQDGFVGHSGAHAAIKAPFRIDHEHIFAFADKRK